MKRRRNDSVLSMWLKEKEPTAYVRGDSNYGKSDYDRLHEGRLR